MGTITRKLLVYRFRPGYDTQPVLQSYDIPNIDGMSVMQALDYIHDHIDSTLAYYSHSACTQGICGQCNVIINGKNGLLCQTLVEDGMVLSVRDTSKVIKDLVYRRGG